MPEGGDSPTRNSHDRVVVALVISNLEYGGAQRQVVALANNLDPDRFDVHVFSLSDYVPLRKDLTIPPVNYHEIRKRKKYDLSVVRRLRQQFLALGIDVVHTFLYDAEIAGRVAGWLARVPRVIGSERNSDYTIKRNQMLFYRLTKFMRHHCISNSRAGASFNGRMLGYAPDHYSVVRNCVDLDRFSPGEDDQLKSELAISPQKLVVGMFASFKHQKNQLLFLNGLRLVKKQGFDCHALFIGDILHGGAQDTGRYYEELRKSVAEFGLSEMCQFIGNRDDVERYYRVCDVTVLCSLFEGTPNVVLESMASGVPAIVTDVSDNALLIEDGQTGFVVPVGDPTRLAEKLIKCIEDRVLCQCLGRRARRAAEQRFSPDRLASDTAEVYLDGAFIRR